MYIVASLDISMHCREDEYPISNTHVNIHVVTECKNKAQDVLNQLQLQEYQSDTVRIWRKASIIEMQQDHVDLMGTTDLCNAIVHDTLSHSS